jgi:hypothetical protein
MWSEVSCIADHACELYWDVVQNRPANERDTITLFLDWPTHPADIQTWTHIADEARTDAPLGAAYTVAISALDAALRTSQCGAYAVQVLSQIATAMTAAPNHDPKFDAPLAAILANAKLLEDLPGAQCAAKIAALPPVAP